MGWRWLRRRPLRTVLTIAGIAIGVALVVAALSVQAAVADGAARYAAALSGRADLTVHAFGEGTLSAGTVDAIAGTPGVIATSPQVRRPTFATAGTTTLGAVTVVGVDPAADRALHDETLASGAFLASSDAGGALVPLGWARAHDLGIGSRFSLVGGGGEATLTVRGLLTDAGPALADGGRLVYTTIGAARALFGIDAGAADLVEVRVDPAVGVAQVETRLESRLTSQPYVLSTAADAAAALGGATRDVGSGLLVVAAIVLFVGALLVSDALAMSVGERTREVGLLRVAGATRGQVRRMVLEEAWWLGLAGTVLGTIAGAAAAVILASAVGSLSGAPVAFGVLDPGALAVGVLLGVLVTLAAALEPAWRTGRVSPVEAVRRGPQLAAPASRVRGIAIAGTVAAVVGVAALVAGGWATGGASVLAGTAARSTNATGIPAPAAGLGGALAALALLLAAGVISPLVLRLAGWLVSAATFPVRRLLRPELRLARGALTHDPGRIAVSLAALGVGLGLVVALAGVAQGTRQAGEAWVRDVAPADAAVVAISPVPVDLGSDLAAVRGVASVTPIRLFDVAIAGRLASAMAVDPATYEALGALSVEGGSRAAAFAALQAGGSALVPRSLASRFGLQVGDLLVLRTAQGEARLRVAGVVAHSIPGTAGESVVVSAADAVRSLGIAGASLFLVRAAPGAASGLGARLEAAASPYALSVVRPSAIGGAVTGALDRTFGLLDLLAVAAVVVAALCIVDVLAMDVRQRVGELGLLRAAGLTRRQAWRFVVVEAGILGLAGAFLGIIGGVVAAGAVLFLGGTTGPSGVLEVSWGAVLAALVLGVGGSMLAAVYPARLAARVEVVRAVGVE